MGQDHLTPDQRHAWNLLVDVIDEELRAQIAIGRLDTPHRDRQTASLIADLIWRVFDVEPKARHRRPAVETD